MREIKFRVWDRISKLMFDVDTIYFLEDSRLEIRLKESYQYEDLVKRGRVDDYKWNLEEGEYSIMQFTGVKDKNDKEIYEGDIVKDFDGKIYEVVWDRFMFNLQLLDYAT